MSCLVSGKRYNIMKSYCTAQSLAKYVSDKYQKDYSEKISSIKLQKSLYFLFAYWGGFVRKGKNKQTELQTSLNEYLFDNKIEAWTYGPVVPDVYHLNDNFKETPIFNPERTVKEFIDGLCDDMFKVSDFKLVEIAHNDECWKRNYKDTDKTHKREIPKEEIIKEYASKI